MKIYSPKTLFCTILFGGGCLVYSIYRILQQELYGYLSALIFIYFIVEGLKISLTKEGFEKEQMKKSTKSSKKGD